MADTKPAIASGTIWAALLAFVPLVAQGLDTVYKSGALPPQVASIVAAVSGLLVIFRRVTNKDVKPISGVVSASGKN